MGRWTQYEESQATPEGMERIGYDSDTHRYTFRQADGSLYEGSEYGGDLRLVSRPSSSKLDDEPIRMFPTRGRPPVPVAHAPTSQTTFADILPSHMIAVAPPISQPSRRLTIKIASPTVASPTRSQYSPGLSPSSSARSLWGIVRSKTVPTRMRDVVETAVRRSSTKKQKDTEGQYERLSNDRMRPQATSSKASGHAKRSTFS